MYTGHIPSLFIAQKVQITSSRKYDADVDEQNRMAAMRLEHWELEQENTRLQDLIDQRNEQFRIKIQRKVDAAVKI